VHFCASRHLSAITGRFKARGKDDDTFRDVSNQTYVRPLGLSLGNCKHCSSRRLFNRSGHNPVDPGCAERPSPAPNDSSHRRPFDDRTAVNDAAASPRCHPANHPAHLAAHDPADDMGSSRSAFDHTHHASTGITRICSAAGDGQPFCEHAT
jgi:hypothetical protein